MSFEYIPSANKIHVNSNSSLTLQIFCMNFQKKKKYFKNLFINFCVHFDSFLFRILCKSLNEQKVINHLLLKINISCELIRASVCGESKRKETFMKLLVLKVGNICIIVFISILTSFHSSSVKPIL